MINKLAIALLLPLFMVGCGGSDSTDDTSTDMTPTTSTPTPTTPTTSTPTPTTPTTSTPTPTTPTTSTPTPTTPTTSTPTPTTPTTSTPTPTTPTTSTPAYVPTSIAQLRSSGKKGFACSRIGGLIEGLQTEHCRGIESEGKDGIFANHSGGVASLLSLNKLQVSTIGISRKSLNSAVDNGDFTVEWSFAEPLLRELSNLIGLETPSGPIFTTLKFYLSKDNILINPNDDNYDENAPDKDLHFYTDINAQPTRTVPCNISSFNIIQCGTFFVIPHQLNSGWLTELPMQASLIIEGCVFSLEDFIDWAVNDAWRCVDFATPIILE